MSAEDPLLVYTIAGGLGATLKADNLARLGQAVTKAGYDGISMTPLRSQTLLNHLLGRYPAHEFVDRLKQYLPRVVLVEDTWNSGEHDYLAIALVEGLAGMIKRKRGDQNEPPTVIDTGFFPGRITSEKTVDLLMQNYPDAYFGAVTVDGLQRFPGRSHLHLQTQFKPHSLSVSQVADIAQAKQIKILYDPTHLAHSDTSVSLPGLPTRASHEEKLRQLKYLGERGLLAGVDIHPGSPDEVDDLLQKTGILLEIAVLACQYGVDFIRTDIIIPKELQNPLLRLDVDAVSQELAQVVDVLRWMLWEG